MSKVKYLYLASLLLLIDSRMSLDPVICSKPCQEGYLVNSECSCSEGKVCIALACPPGQRRDFRDCACKDKDSILPYKPIICKNTSCPPNQILNSECQCVPKASQCLIRQCHPRFKLTSSCSCERRRGAICRKGCPKGMTIYAIPGRVNCKCEPRVKCPIRKCARGAELINCRCVTPSSQQCPIRKCRNMFVLDRSRCRCRVEPLPSCKKGCGPGRMIKPGTCRCVRKPRCPIRICKSGYKLNRKKCQCEKRKSIREFDFDFEFRE